MCQTAAHDQLEGEFQSWMYSKDACYKEAVQMLEGRSRQAGENLDWLYGNMPGYFFITMENDVEALTNLILGLQTLRSQRKIVLLDQPRKLIVARLDVPGSLYDMLTALNGRDISYAEITHSWKPVAGTERNLEVLRFEFDRKSLEELAKPRTCRVPAGTRDAVRERLTALYPAFNFKEFNKNLDLFWRNSENYVRLSPPERIARILWLYQQGLQHEGLFLDVEATGRNEHRREHRILFSVENPPHQGFLTQAMEVFKRLGIGVRRSYSLNISGEPHSYFLGNFYVARADGLPVTRESNIFRELKGELYNTQILATENAAYSVFVSNGFMSGEDASLVNAFIAFCQTTLGHCEPDRFSTDVVKDAFFSHPHIVMKLIDTFRKRFDPELTERDKAYEDAREEAQAAVESYNTGHRHLDEIRRMIYKTCFLLITKTLKTNFFVPEKHALAFRLDPSYLSELGPEFTKDLPGRVPFRVTFFFGRRGFGYHIGFSDIARGGWRTILCGTHDELTTNSNSLFREVFVLAHTQHLKNKDIYEGGSKLVVILDARGLETREAVMQQMHKLQYAITNAFLDIFITEGGKAKDRRVVDHYGDDEPIELGPDENMSDAMIEIIARQAMKRGYVLGSGIISSKRAGINHKHYGVTSRGVIRAATIAMREIGIDMTRDPFSLKIIGGPNGDVAGNSIRLLLERCPKARIVSITDISGALYDPQGADPEGLGRIVLQTDVGDFNPELLHPGGFMLFSRHTVQESLKELYRKLARTDSGLEETWLTTDEYQNELAKLIFSEPVDLFLPCGGRPETIDENNCPRFFHNGGNPSARIIVEGANSYITPGARVALQKGGVIILRDASANKCGVITSSYEIIANVLMTEREFLKNKDAYVGDVLRILDRKADEEANLIFKRYRAAEGRQLYTDISAAVSEEINGHYERLFAFFRNKSHMVEQPLFFKVLLHHLPALVQNNPKYRARVRRIPVKMKCAILASEIASSIVYHGGWDDDFEGKLHRYLDARFS